MKARVISSKGKFALEFSMAMPKAGGRCEAFPVVGPGEPIRCSNKADEVVEDGARHIAMCCSCRRAGVGPTPAEQAAKTKGFRSRQAPLFPGES